MKQLKNKLVAIILLLLFSAYYVSILAFTHIHYINGAMVVHSHPSAGNEHTHTDAEYYFIAHLSSFETLKATFQHITPAKVPLLYVLSHTRKISCHEGIYLKGTNLRAPPVMASL